MKPIVFVAALAAATSAGAITVETTDFITAPTNRNSFEGLGATTNYPGTSGYTEDGITVTYVGTPGLIWTTSQPAADGLYSWYPDGSSDGYTRLTFGGTITAVEFRAGSGLLFGSATLLYDVRLGGVSQGSGVAGPVPLDDDGFLYYGFSGGNFDEVRLKVINENLTVFDPTSQDFGTFDDIQFGAGRAVIPEPATWAMMIAGFGLVGMTARRRRSIRAVH